MRNQLLVVCGSIAFGIVLGTMFSSRGAPPVNPADPAGALGGPTAMGGSGIRVPLVSPKAAERAPSSGHMLTGDVQRSSDSGVVATDTNGVYSDSAMEESWMQKYDYLSGEDRVAAVDEMYREMARVHAAEIQRYVSLGLSTVLPQDEAQIRPGDSTKDRLAAVHFDGAEYHKVLVNRAGSPDALALRDEFFWFYHSTHGEPHPDAAQSGWFGAEAVYHGWLR